MWQRKDAVAGDASLRGCISGAVGGRYGPRGVYRGSYSLGVIAADLAQASACREERDWRFGV